MFYRPWKNSKKNLNPRALIRPRVKLEFPAVNFSLRKQPSLLNLPFLLCVTLYFRAISKYKPQRGLYLQGWFNECFFFFFCLTSLGGLYHFGRAYTRRGLFSEFYGVYFQLQLKTHLKQRCPSDKTDGITPIPIRRARSE